MHFTVCQNSIEKYDFYTVALYVPPVLPVAKSPVLLGLKVDNWIKGTLAQHCPHPNMFVPTVPLPSNKRAGGAIAPLAPPLLVPLS